MGYSPGDYCSWLLVLDELLERLDVDEELLDSELLELIECVLDEELLDRLLVLDELRLLDELTEWVELLDELLSVLSVDEVLLEELDRLDFVLLELLDDSLSSWRPKM